MNPCTFCRIIRGEDATANIVYQDDRTIVFTPLSPATRGHLLVVPKSHASQIWDVDEDDAAAIAKTVVMVSDALRSLLDLEGLNVIQSNGSAATQTVNHVHFHVLPRWKNDRMRLRWPRQSAQTLSEQHVLAATVREALGQSQNNIDVLMSPEDRRQHLSFIQSVISRMASASASAKTWLLPIVTAAYGYAFVERSFYVGIFGIAAVLVFALLDANYLKQERSFRGLYDRVARGERIPKFSMNPTVAGPDKRTNANYWPDSQDWKSWAIAPFYLPMLLIGVALSVYLWPHC